jgi:4-methyl-5(b-hydroxyethyl)-thiazole monophosphate biosynthesis
MIYMFLAPGFEEVEALAPLDLLRRAGLAVTTVAVTAPDTEHAVQGSHGITVLADMSTAAFRRYVLWGESDAPIEAAETIEAAEIIEAVILPGGMPGTTNLDASPEVDAALALAHGQGAYLCAICAAPLVLGKRGYLAGKRATCYPGFEDYLTGAEVGGKVIRDGRFITAAGMGVAQEFGLELVSALVSPEKAAEIRAAIQSL